MAVAWDRRLGMGAQGLDVGFGAAMVTADLPLVFDQNVVWVQRAVEPQRVLDAVEEVADQAAWRHRTIEITDDAVAERLRPALLAAGYAENRNLTMVLSEDHPPVADDAAAVLVTIEQQRGLARALLAEEPWVTDTGVLDQFAERERRLAQVADGQAVVAPGADPVSRCLLLRDGGFFEIDSVMTLSQHRGKGWSSAIMARAMRVGAATGRPIVLVADSSDWPARWYERLGFRTEGVLTQFRRWPEKDPAPGM